MNGDALAHVPMPLYWLTHGFISACTHEILSRAGGSGQTKFDTQDDFGEEVENGDTVVFGGTLTGPYRDDGFQDWAVQISFLSERNMSSPATVPEGFSDQPFSVPEAFHLMRDSWLNTKATRAKGLMHSTSV